MKQITKKQHSMLQHCLGISGGDIEHRNYYADEPDSKDCNALVDEGMMVLGKRIPGGLRYFHVTTFGRRIANNDYKEYR